MTIELNCPHCGKFLRTSDDKAGETAKCPGCGELITIPSAGELEHAELVEAGSAHETAVDNDDRKPCPVCGEMIRKEARKCRFCGEDIDGGVRADASDKVTSLEVGDILSASWAKFKDHMGLALGAVIVAAILQNIPYFALVILLEIAEQGGNDEAMAALMIVAMPVLLLLFIAATAYFTGGTIRVMLNIVRDRDPRFTDLFSLTPWGSLSMLIAGFLGFLCYMVGIFLCIVPGVIVLLMWMPFPFLIVEEGLGPLASLSEAKRLTDGSKLNVFLIGLVGYGILLAGMMACYVGLLFALPLWWIMLTELYVRLKARAGIALEPAVS